MLTLVNKSSHIAQFVVYKGGQVICKLPGIAPGGSIKIPTDDTYTVTASTEFKKNVYTSAPVTITGSTGFVAQVRQHRAEGGYAFEIEQKSSSAPASLSFQKTTLNAVTFTILKDGQPLQNIVVEDSFTEIPLDISDTFSVYAVCDGVTTDNWVTTNPEAVITLSPSNTWLESGYPNLAAV